MSFIINSYAFGGGGGGTPIPTGNLVLYQRFNNSLTDETGNHTPSGTGINYGNGIYSGSSNEAVDINSMTGNQRVEIPDSNLLSFGDGSIDSPFSISLAVNIDVLGTSNTFLLNKRGDRGTSNPNVNREYQISYNTTSSVLSFVLFDDSASALLFIQGVTSLSTGTNYHLTFTYDGSASASGMKIYVNGVEESSYTDASSGSYTAMENLTAPVTIGQLGWANGSNAANNFDGRMDGLAIWDKELSAAEVTAIYNEQSSGNELL